MKSIHYLIAIAVITVIMGLIYVSVQQTYRTNANDPQVQIARDLKRQIEQKGIDDVSFPDTVRLESGLGVFAIAYNIQGVPVKSAALIKERTPRMNAGVLKYVQEHGEDWITWEPHKGIRLATGVLRVHGGPVAYLAVGRSLKEVEESVSRLVDMILIGWVLCVAFVLIHALVDFYFTKKARLATWME